jgi:hypothetical protein
MPKSLAADVRRQKADTGRAGDGAYVGTELEHFAAATNWKNYWARKIAPYVGERVLDVGAGIGADPALAEKMRASDLPAACEIRVGAISAVSEEDRFDSILYIDVLEHIEDDRSELARAAGHLSHGGHLIVLAPAHQALFTPFDQAIGHFRRYDRRSLAAVAPPELQCIKLFYLDSVGMLASLGNKLLLKSSTPSASQIWLWDKIMVPASRLLDPLTGRRLGKSVVGVWRKP